VGLGAGDGVPVVDGLGVDGAAAGAWPVASEAGSRSAEAGLAPEGRRGCGTFVVSVQEWLLRRLVAKAEVYAYSTVTGDRDDERDGSGECLDARVRERIWGGCSYGRGGLEGDAPDGAGGGSASVS
jgi:hypothetical protein